MQTSGHVTALGCFHKVTPWWFTSRKSLYMVRVWLPCIFVCTSITWSARRSQRAGAENGRKGRMGRMGRKGRSAHFSMRLFLTNLIVFNFEFRRFSRIVFQLLNLWVQSPNSICITHFHIELEHTFSSWFMNHGLWEISQISIRVIALSLESTMIISLFPP